MHEPHHHKEVTMVVRRMQASIFIRVTFCARMIMCNTWQLNHGAPSLLERNCPSIPLTMEA